MSIKFLLVGGVFWVLGGGECRFYFYGARIFLNLSPGLVFPGLRGTYESFWPPPLHVADPHPTVGYPDPKVRVCLCSFFLPMAVFFREEEALRGIRNLGNVLLSV